MMSLSEIQALQQKVAAMQRDADRAEGALNQTMNQLKIDFGCDTIEDAERKLKQLERAEHDAEEEATAALREFEKAWAKATVRGGDCTRRWTGHEHKTIDNVR